TNNWTGTTFTSGQLAYSGNSDWIGSNKMVPVTITYNKGAANTWIVNVNGIDVINYSDPRNTEWASISGPYWGFGSYSGATGASVSLRSVELAYTPSDSGGVAVSSIVPPAAFSFSSMLSKAVYGLVSGWTWKVYDGKFSNDVTYFSRNHYIDIGRSTNCTNLSTFTNGNYNIVGTPTNTSFEFFGYFLATSSGYWSFYLNSDDNSLLWLGNTALYDYTLDNASVNISSTGSNYTSYYMDIGNYYPMRIQYSNTTGTGDLGLSFVEPSRTYQLDALSGS